MKTVRASEISSYVYCHRSWWYQRRGYPSENVSELAGGIELHEKHGRSVMVSGCLMILAYGLLILALIVLTIWLTNKML